mmetsp:Transcript_11390/g.41682  ORF Transcript_11390/g.41682 Transcript_11390/m.41682 type:complete len:292 (-) Transcript_11390:153-1028(-)
MSGAIANAAQLRAAAQVPLRRRSPTCTASSPSTPPRRPSEHTSQQQEGFETQDKGDSLTLSKRELALGAATLMASSAWLSSAAPSARAVNGMFAGRVPGITTELDENGFYTYTRPNGKGGGHGVGWSEFPPYTFLVPPGWDEVPVSIADLGGTEVDLRFVSTEARNGGNLLVVIAPVLRFADVGFNADVQIDQLATPLQIISGFAPELLGYPLDEDQLLSAEVVSKQAGEKEIPFYMYQVAPHILISATATRNRLYLAKLEMNGKQWRTNAKVYEQMIDSFRPIIDSSLDA